MVGGWVLCSSAPIHRPRLHYILGGGCTASVTTTPPYPSTGDGIRQFSSARPRQPCSRGAAAVVGSKRCLGLVEGILLLAQQPWRKGLNLHCNTEVTFNTFQNSFKTQNSTGQRSSTPRRMRIPKPSQERERILKGTFRTASSQFTSVHDTCKKQYNNKIHRRSISSISTNTKQRSPVALP